MNMATAHRLIAFLMWFVGVGIIIAPAAWEISNDTIGAVMMFTALVLIRISDLEDRIKRMGGDA